MTQPSKSKLIAGILASAMVFVIGVAAQTSATNPMKSNAKPKAEKAAKAPKSDSEVQECITQKLAAAPKLKGQGFSATVANGEATFTGTASNGGSKGAVSGIAKSCGAKKVVNNITVKAPEKPAKPEAKKK